MTSFTDRMIGAAKLDVRIYEEVEGDTSATGQAMGVVLLASLANAIGAGLGGLGPFVVVGIGALIGWPSRRSRFTSLGQKSGQKVKRAQM